MIIERKRSPFASPAAAAGLILFLLLAAFPASGLTAQPLVRGVSKTSGIQVPILAYHYISPDLPPAGYEEYFLTPGQFSAQLDVIQALGYTTVHLEDLALYKINPLNHPLPARPVVITFDDGSQNNYTYAYPALKNRGMTATFFIVTNYIHNSDSQRCAANWDGLPSCFMIWSEIQTLYAQGFEIGAHSKTHPNLTTLNSASAAEEISGSRQALEAVLGAGSVHFFAYPYGLGAGNAEVKALVAAAGYHGAVAYGPPDRPSDLLADDFFALPRLAVQRNHSLSLNSSDPYWFFPTRLDPAFPLPDITLSGVQVKDAEGGTRSQFYPGEPLTVTVDAANYNQPQDILGRLKFANGLGAAYDSRLAQPSADVPALPFPGSPDGEHFLFDYPWVIPTGAHSLGTYPFQWIANDPPSGLLEYLQYDSSLSGAGAFEVLPKPISLAVDPPRLPLAAGQILTLTLTLKIEPGYSGAGTYLTVSFSEHLAVLNHTASHGSWSQVYTVCKKGGACVPAQYLTFELFDPLFGSATQTYTLTVQALPGISASDWMKFRVAMRMDQSTLTNDYYLRDPLSGDTDQQDYYAFRIQAVGSYKTFVPLVER